jgi:hypothetical protein
MAKRKRRDRPVSAPVMFEARASSLIAPEPDGADFPYPADLPVLVDLHQHVLLGRSRMRGAIGTLQTMELHASAEHAGHLQAMDALGKPPPSVRAKAAWSLRQCRIPARWIQQILDLPNPSMTSRWCGLYKRVPWTVLRALDKREIRFAHARLLAAISPEFAAATLPKIIHNGWTPSALRQFIQTGAGPDHSIESHLERLADQIGEKLACKVEILWPASPAKRALVLHWFDPESLKGILEHLTHGPIYAPEQDRDNDHQHHERKLVIHLRTNDELEALIGHMTD